MSRQTQPQLPSLTAPTQVPRLTKREKQIMRLLFTGKSARETAEALSLSTRTVDFHTSNVYRKLHASNRMQALNRMVELNLFATLLVEEVPAP
jgi:LuxR family maltose regulon positive regulatory protein